MTKTFIIGPPRSGTTLVLDLLRKHPDVAGHSSDFHPFHHNLMLFRDRQERDDHFRLTTGDATQEIAAAYHQAIAQELEASGRKHFVLKISTLSIQVDYIRALIPDARFIQIVRDGRDATCSIEDLRRTLEETQGHERALGPAPDPFGLWCAEHFENKHLRAAATWYYHVTRSWLDLQFVGVESVLRIRYEELIADPQATLGRVLTFIGIDSSPEIEAALADVQDAPGEPGGLGFSISQASGDKRVGRHATELSKDTRAAIAPLLEVPMHLHGYDPDWLSEPARFDRGCTAIGVDPDEWRTRIESEQDWFALHSRAFAPERLLGQPDVPNGGSRPLLVDGATCGCSQRVVDGVAVEAISWVQKQDRRHTFADHDQIWPTVAASLDGDHTVDRLRERFDLREDAINMLSVLHGLGFVAYV